MQRTETFHKVFDADDVEVIILECVSLFMATTTKLQKTNLREEEHYSGISHVKVGLHKLPLNLYIGKEPFLKHQQHNVCSRNSILPIFS